MIRLGEGAPKAKPGPSTATAVLYRRIFRRVKALGLREGDPFPTVGKRAPPAEAGCRADTSKSYECERILYCPGDPIGRAGRPSVAPSRRRREEK